MRKVLVPLDGSPLSEAAIPYARALVAGSSCELALLSVWEILPEEIETVGAAHAKVLRDQGMRYFRTYLGNISQALEQCEVFAEVRSGHPAIEIMIAAAEMDADFIVMASHGRRAAMERRRGSVADKVLRGSRVPVLIVGPAILRRRAPADVQLRSLLLPLDGSHESEAAVDVALEIAARTGGQITLLRVVPPVLSPAEGGLVDTYPPELDTHFVKSARSYLKRFKAAHPEAIASTVVERGRPSQAILEFVDQLRPDLIVMSSRSRYSGDRWALGSVADDVMDGPVPVVVVHPATAAEAAEGPVASTAAHR